MALGMKSAVLIQCQHPVPQFQLPVVRQISGEGDLMDDVEKSTESQSADRPVGSGEETAVKTVARKVGSTIGAIAAKVTGSPAKPNANAYDARRLEIKKHKRSAHRRKLKSSHTKG